MTKFRHRVFWDDHLVRLEEILRDVCSDFEVELVEFNGESNNVHMLLHFPPKVALAKLGNSLKGVSSRRLRQELPDLVQHYWRAQKLWSASYFAGSVGGAPFDVVKEYIENQNRPPGPLSGRFTSTLKDGALSLQVASRRCQSYSRCVGVFTKALRPQRF